jgi:hypothetical protein
MHALRVFMAAAAIFVVGGKNYCMPNRVLSLVAIDENSLTLPGESKNFESTVNPHTATTCTRLLLMIRI